MRKLLALFFLFSLSCTDSPEPDQAKDPLKFYFEVEVEGQKFRQELSPSLPDSNHPLMFQGGFNTQINQGCIPGDCITPFFINMLFSDALGKQPWEQIEMIQVPSGSYTSHNWFGGSNLTPTPTTGFVTITKKSLEQNYIQGTFEGEVYKTGTQTPVKFPIKGSFTAKFQLN
ncbi:MAG: hypothetical protein C0433_05910 [Cyclobacterium sp.]|nr:hypothetical protein [Cyclobacterium sp.]